MMRSSLAFAGLLLIAAGCSELKPDASNADDTNSLESPQGNAANVADDLVGGFKSPELAGLAVRDHEQGVQVVTPPAKRGTTAPPIGSNDLLWSLAPGAIFTSVNDVPAKDAKHFRDLMDAIEPGAELRLGQTLFMEDAGNGMVSLRTSPPEGQ